MNETVRRLGSRNRRILAMPDSIIAIARATSRTLTAMAWYRRPGGHGQVGGDAPGEEDVAEDDDEQHQFDPGGQLHHGQLLSGVLQQHALVDHGQLQVGGRVVEGHPRVLGHKGDEEGGGGQEQRCKRPDPVAAKVIGYRR